MTVDELRGALYSGVPLLWQGSFEYHRARGYCSAVIERRGPAGETVYSGELTTNINSIIICKTEELSFWFPKRGGT